MLFALMTRFDKSVQLEQLYNEVHHKKGLTDGVGRFWVGKIKETHDKHSGRIRKDCAVHSINLPFPR